jgi:transposase
MLYAGQPTDEELQEPKRMTGQEVGGVSQRAQMALLSIRPKTISEIADMLEACCATVRFWIKRFNAEGPVGLYDRERSGRPPKSTEQVKDTIVWMIQDEPGREGYLATF